MGKIPKSICGNISRGILSFKSNYLEQDMPLGNKNKCLVFSGKGKSFWTCMAGNL